MTMTPEFEAMLRKQVANFDPVRERVVERVAELAQVVADSTQAWDIAVADFIHDIEQIAEGGAWAQT